jgi:hypothetical protein
MMLIIRTTKDARRQANSHVFRGCFRSRWGRRPCFFWVHSVVSQINCHSFPASCVRQCSVLASPPSAFVGGTPLICTRRHDVSHIYIPMLCNHSPPTLDMSQDSLRRSARIHSPSYRPWTTWDLPHVLTVSIPFPVSELPKKKCCSNRRPQPPLHRLHPQLKCLT